MTSWYSHQAREQPNISSFRKRAQHRTPPASWQSPEAFMAFTRLFWDGRVIILPANGHAVKNEGWPQSDKANDKEKFPRAPQNHWSPAIGLTGRHTRPAPTLPGLGWGGPFLPPIAVAFWEAGGVSVGSPEWVLSAEHCRQPKSGCSWRRTVGPGVISEESPINLEED